MASVNQPPPILRAGVVPRAPDHGVNPSFVWVFGYVSQVSEIPDSEKEEGFVRDETAGTPSQTTNPARLIRCTYMRLQRPNTNSGPDPSLTSVRGPSRFPTTLC